MVQVNQYDFLQAAVAGQAEESATSLER